MSEFQNYSKDEIKHLSLQDSQYGLIKIIIFWEKTTNDLLTWDSYIDFLTKVICVGFIFGSDS